MKNLTDRVKDFIPFIAHSMISETTGASFDFIKRKQKMLEEFKFCLQHGNLVGVYCPILGNGMFLAGVENIIWGDDGSPSIVFFPFDMSGHALARRSIELNEITSIVPFNNPYISPVTFTVDKIPLAS
jgi:hypothetical protein